MALRKGTRGIDTLVGTATHDLIVAYNGNDVLHGLAGNDKIYAGGGNDSIDGGTGDDTLYGNGGADTIVGGDGNDIIQATENDFGPVTQPNLADLIFAGAGFDFVTMDHVDTAFGGSGVDSFVMNTDTDTAARWDIDLSQIGSTTAVRIAAAGTYFGACRVGQFEGASLFLRNALAGSEVIGSNGRDSIGMEKAFLAPDTAIFTIEGRGGDDYIIGSTGRDRLLGGAGDDQINGGYSGGPDTILGGNGDDEITGGGGKDVLTGGAGIDQFAFSLSETVATALPKITDFTRADDLLVFTQGNLDVDFGSEVNLLRIGATVTNGNTASGVAQFLYSTSTGKLAVDVNGSDAGGVTALVFLAGAPTITASDILLTGGFGLF